jgi:hypothetical protein
MTDLQREVYRGRNMGCMNCGRPFKVDAAPQRAVNGPPEPSAPQDAPPGESLDPAASGSSAATAVAVLPHEEEADPAYADAAAAAKRAAAVARRPAREPVKFSPGSNLPAVGSVVLGVLLFVFVAAAAVAGYAGSDDQLAPGQSRIGSGTPGTFILLAIISGGLAVLAGAVGVFLASQPVPSARADDAPADGSDPGAPAAPPPPDPTPETPRGGKGYALTGLLLGGSGLLVGAVLAAMLLPSLNRAREEASRDRCAANLEQIALSLRLYLTGEPTGRLPDSLAPLVAGYNLRAEVLICPGSGDKVAPGQTSAEQSANLETRAGHQSYVYAGKGLTAQAIGNNADLVIAYEPLKHHGDGIHVLFADGKILFVEKTLAAQFITEMKAGQNPPPAVAVIRPGG